MFGLSFWEIAVIAAVALLVLGPKRLPELAKSLGRGLREVRKATADIRNAVADPLEEMRQPLTEMRDDIMGAVKGMESEVKKAQYEVESELSDVQRDWEAIGAETPPPQLAKAKPNAEAETHHIGGDQPLPNDEIEDDIGADNDQPARLAITSEEVAESSTNAGETGPKIAIRPPQEETVERGSSPDGSLKEKAPSATS